MKTLKNDFAEIIKAEIAGIEHHLLMGHTYYGIAIFADPKHETAVGRLDVISIIFVIVKSILMKNFMLNFRSGEEKFNLP